MWRSLRNIRSLEYIRSDSRSSRRAYSRLVMLFVEHNISEGSSSGRSVASSSSSLSAPIGREGVDIDGWGVSGRGLSGVVDRRGCNIEAERGWSSNPEMDPKLRECKSGMSGSYTPSEGSSVSSAMGASDSEREGE